jgi:hypothetical protein
MKENSGLGWMKQFLIVLTLIMVLTFSLVLVGSGLKNSQTDSTGSITNETITMRNSTQNGNVTSWTALELDEGIFTVIRINNGTTLVPATNYTYSTSTGRITLVTGSIWTGVLANVTATYTYNNPEQSVIKTYTTQVGTVGEQVNTWIALAGLVIIVGIIGIVIYTVARFGTAKED